MSSRLIAIIIALLAWHAFATEAAASVSVISAGADGGSARIAIRSVIKKGDLAAFQAAIDRVEHTAKTKIAGVLFVTVELNSPGGDVVEAVGIGRALYGHSAFTMVRPGQECVSACVFILAAGAVRMPLGSAAIGVHKPLLVAWRHMEYRQARAEYDGLMRYLRQYFLDLGISEEAYNIMMGTSSSDMRYFSAAELERLGLRGVSPDWLKHYGLREPISAPSSAPTAAAQGPAKLPEIDESYRYVVFMPGNLPPSDYYAGTTLEPPRFVWSSLDDFYRPVDWYAPDIMGYAGRIYRVLRSVLGQDGWLIAVLALELVRGLYSPLPARIPHRRPVGEGWRLLSLRRYGEDHSSFSSGS